MFPFAKPLLSKTLTSFESWGTKVPFRKNPFFGEEKKLKWQ
jgi:hypothetical protein